VGKRATAEGGVGEGKGEGNGEGKGGRGGGSEKLTFYGEG
jgi:hypothetical protein